jgi:hypothetical protein
MKTASIAFFSIILMVSRLAAQNSFKLSMTSNELVLKIPEVTLLAVNHA